MRSIRLTILFCVAALLMGCGTSNLTIKWSEESSHFITRGGYARIKKVDNRHALVYDAGRSVWICFSNDKCDVEVVPLAPTRSSIIGGGIHNLER